ncbi:DUF1631 domain-containing protein [Marinicella gelatinilytica]|uniref:DUF1631 domain-containing protein n=1 Tax=Marinicella gelatinilytica TaxID=2996017 RepID=UPI002260A99A|nr:DUF1631 domain-containing protein [Marinicella gelatinilytica]MCX7544684.1 DUF1631 domain-containing protein [Marinicella gelatinilytica]
MNDRKDNKPYKDNKNIVNIQNNPEANLGQILPKIHKIFITGLKPSIQKYFDKLDDTLFDMAEKAETNDMQTQYFEAMRTVRKKKELMVRKFSDNIQHAFKQFKKGDYQYIKNQDSDDNLTSEDGLSLVEEKELDKKLAVTNLIDKSNTYFHKQLYALEKRFTLLAGGTDLKLSQIPVSPYVIVHAFAAPLDLLNIEVNTLLIIIKLYERSLIENLTKPYEDINQYLISQGIYPDIKFKLPGQQSTGASSYRPSEQSQTHQYEQQQTQMPQTRRYENQAAIDDHTFQTILSALNERHQGSTTPTAVYDSSVINSALGLLQSHELQQMNAGGSALSPKQIKQVLIQRLQELDVEGGEQRNVNKSDEDTIDLISMLFEFLVEDRNLPAQIQVLLSRLQIPYLHIALKDRKLFSNKNDNARKLLDVLAKASIGWTEESDRNKHFINKIESIVQHILEHQQDDIDFPSVIEDFQEFDAKNKKKTKVIEKRTYEKALGEERIFNAKAKTAEILESKMQNYQLPKQVTDLLLTPWANVLTLIHLRHHDEPDVIEPYVKFVDKLIFVSVKDKKKQATKAQVSHVCDFLSNGLRLVAFDERNVKQKTSDLYQLLLEINALEEASDQDHEFVLPQEAFSVKEDEDDQPEIVHFIANKKINDQARSIEHIEDQHFTEAEALIVGDWIEFVDADADGNIRAKLSWISPISHKRLFVNARGIKVTDKSVDEIAHDFRTGNAHKLDQVPLFDRAMNAIADKVEDKSDSDEAINDEK